jgi:hypothetical protein
MAWDFLMSQPREETPNSLMSFAFVLVPTPTRDTRQAQTIQDQVVPTWLHGKAIYQADVRFRPKAEYHQSG